MINRAEGFGICPSFKDHFCRAVPNPDITIRNFCIAVLRPRPSGTAHPEECDGALTRSDIGVGVGALRLRPDVFPTESVVAQRRKVRGGSVPGPVWTPATRVVC